MPYHGFAGGGIRFDPGTLTVISDQPISDFAFFSNDGKIEWPDRDFDDRARVMHERDHLLRTLCCSHGIFRHVLHSRMLGEAIQYLNLVPAFSPEEAPLERGDSEFRRRVWAYGTDSQRLVADAQTWSDADRHLLRYLAGMALMNLLDGDLPSDVAQLAELGLGLCDFMLKSNSPLPTNSGHYQSVFVDETYPAWVPMVQAGNLSARDIYEAFALETESLYAVRMGRPRHRPTDLVDHTAYQRVVMLALKYFGSIRPGKLPLEVDAAADLALWIPITLRGNQMAGQPWNWIDLEPGHRLIRAFEVLKDIPHSEFHFAEDMDGLADCDAAVRCIQSKLCASLTWPEPADLAALLLEELEEVERSNTTRSYFALVQEPSPRLLWSSDLLRAYQTAPFSMYYPVDSVMKQHATPIWFPCGVFCDKDFAMTGLAFDGQETQWSEYQIFFALRMMMEGPWAHPVPRHHAAIGLELAGVYGESLLGESGLRSKLVSVAKDMLKWEPWRAPQVRVSEFNE